MQVLILFILCWFSYLIGYQQAHVDVSQECSRLGSFYVGDKTFECKPK